MRQFKEDQQLKRMSIKASEEGKGEDKEVQSKDKEMSEPREERPEQKP